MRLMYRLEDLPRERSDRKTNKAVKGVDKESCVLAKGGGYASEGTERKGLDIRTAK